MAKRTVNIGSAANDDTGDTLRSSMDKLNQNFDESYRERITSARTYYVSTAGNDSNDGLTVGTPFLTIQHAIDVVCNTLYIEAAVTIQLADGTYNVSTPIQLRHYTGSSLISIEGNSGTPSNVVINATSGSVIGIINNYSRTSIWRLLHFKLTAGVSINGLFADRYSYIDFSNLVFGAGIANHIYAHGGFISCVGNYTIEADANAHAVSWKQGRIEVMGKTVTITGTPAFDFAFADAEIGGVIDMSGNTFSGSATGKRYNAATNGVISTGGATLPGSISGTTATGGQYV